MACISGSTIKYKNKEDLPKDIKLYSDENQIIITQSTFNESLFLNPDDVYMTERNNFYHPPLPIEVYNSLSEFGTIIGEIRIPRNTEKNLELPHSEGNFYIVHDKNIGILFLDKDSYNKVSKDADLIIDSLKKGEQNAGSKIPERLWGTYTVIEYARVFNEISVNTEPGGFVLFKLNKYSMEFKNNTSTFYVLSHTAVSSKAAPFQQEGQKKAWDSFRFSNIDKTYYIWQESGNTYMVLIKDDFATMTSNSLSRHCYGYRVILDKNE